MVLQCRISIQSQALHTTLLLTLSFLSLLFLPFCMAHSGHDKRKAAIPGRLTKTSLSTLPAGTPVQRHLTQHLQTLDQALTMISIPSSI